MDEMRRKLGQLEHSLDIERATNDTLSIEVRVVMMCEDRCDINDALTNDSNIADNVSSL